MDIKEFVKKRDEALLSLDKEKIIDLLQISGAIKKQPDEDIVFWAGVHYARLGVVAFSEEVKQQSREWLKSNGFNC